MHAMIIPRLVDSSWEINVLAWNVQYLFLAVQLWRPWWQRGDLPITEMRHGGSKAVAASIAVFVLLPALVAFGLIDPYPASAFTQTTLQNSLWSCLPAALRCHQ
jgi:hypothetical protein